MEAVSVTRETTGRELPGENRDLRECNCDSPVRAYGMAAGANAYGSAPKYVKNRY